jgi:hypothetical protein
MPGAGNWGYGCLVTLDSPMPTGALSSLSCPKPLSRRYLKVWTRELSGWVPPKVTHTDSPQQEPASDCRLALPRLLLTALLVVNHLQMFVSEELRC